MVMLSNAQLLTQVDDLVKQLVSVHEAGLLMQADGITVGMAHVVWEELLTRLQRNWQICNIVKARWVSSFRPVSAFSPFLAGPNRRLRAQPLRPPDAWMGDLAHQLRMCAGWAWPSSQRRGWSRSLVSTWLVGACGRKWEAADSCIQRRTGRRQVTWAVTWLCVNGVQE